LARLGLCPPFVEHVDDGAIARTHPTEVHDHAEGVLLVRVGRGVTVPALALAAVTEGVLAGRFPASGGFRHHPATHAGHGLAFLVLDHGAHHLADQGAGRVVRVIAVDLTAGCGEHPAAVAPDYGQRRFLDGEFAGESVQVGDEDPVDFRA
jgi:hypothetical protein